VFGKVDTFWTHQHQASLNTQITALQGELRITVVIAESCVAVVAERDASFALIRTQLERALKDKTMTSIALAQARATLTKTVRVFQGLAIQVRPMLEALGLEPPQIPSKPEGHISLWFAYVVGRIGSLPKRLRQVMQIEGEHVVNLVGNLILT
jgi:hypothetical protein